ncbi:uncharacterized protein LOC122858585 isoform X2 [Aphidius gifuensis]|uniref:uncharacterized protein LOC122858585 isoform X2 n=1 Tax=Aphidius gifuensis TaxID=684658 RepID=UPI001CDD3C27|nr:uncharacterized protein LOC122858585 isoform X2 [Aphidius gifuensis]
MNEDFNYIVKKQDKQKICFGSGRPRDLDSRNGMTSFMRYYTPENYTNISPGKYNVIESFKAATVKPCSKSFSKKGYSGLARFSTLQNHQDDYPAPGDYNVSSFPAKVKDTSKYPFGTTAKRKTQQINDNPGPGVYSNLMPRKKNIIFDHSFGGNAKMRLGVDIKCCKKNIDICNVCNKKPDGDYWHLNDRIFICRGCMKQERKKVFKYPKNYFNNFTKIRDCSMIHSHEGTDAKLWLMNPGIIEKWLQKEAYLSLYFKD